MARKQTERMNLRMTPEEKSMIFERVIQAGCPSINRFVVKMCSEGKIVSNEALREINKELHYQGNNLNQLTRLAHLGEIKVIDLSKLLATYEKLLETIAKESEKHSYHSEYPREQTDSLGAGQAHKLLHQT